MKKRPRIASWPLLAMLVAAVAAEAAFVAGNFAYATGASTNVVREPHTVVGAGGTLAGHLTYRQQVRIDQVQDKWVHVAAGPVSGWVFSGNLSDTQPPEVKNSAGYGLSAAQTNVSAASRAIGEVGADYSVRHNLGQARQDLDWLTSQCATFKDADIEAYLKAQKKGEFQ